MQHTASESISCETLQFSHKLWTVNTISRSAEWESRILFCPLKTYISLWLCPPPYLFPLPECWLIKPIPFLETMSFDADCSSNCTKNNCHIFLENLQRVLFVNSVTIEFSTSWTGQTPPALKNDIAMHPFYPNRHWWCKEIQISSENTGQTHMDSLFCCKTLHANAKVVPPNCTTEHCCIWGLQHPLHPNSINITLQITFAA